MEWFLNLKIGNIEISELTYSLESFKNLSQLYVSFKILINLLKFLLKVNLTFQMIDCSPRRIIGKTTVRQSVKKLICHYALQNLWVFLFFIDFQNNIILFQEILLDENYDINDNATIFPSWKNCAIADFSFNSLSTIDRSVVEILETKNILNF